MIVPEHKLPIVQQCNLIGLAPSTLYYKPEPVSENDLRLMFRIDQLHPLGKRPLYTVLSRGLFFAMMWLT